MLAEFRFAGVRLRVVVDGGFGQEIVDNHHDVGLRDEGGHLDDVSIQRVLVANVGAVLEQEIDQPSGREKFELIR